MCGWWSTLALNTRRIKERMFMYHVFTEGPSRLAPRKINNKALVRGLYSALFLTICCFILGGRQANAQEFAGHVSDTSGAAVPKATITVINQDTGITLTSLTTGSGDYKVPYLKPGKYTLAAESKGFNREEKTDITLQVGQTAVINFSLKVGSITQTVI